MLAPLRDAHRTALRSRGVGPQAVAEALGAYLAAEQELGRVTSEIDPRAAAGLLLGACLERAFLGHFIDPADRPSAEEFATSAVGALLNGLAPRQP